MHILKNTIISFISSKATEISYCIIFFSYFIIHSFIHLISHLTYFYCILLDLVKTEIKHTVLILTSPRSRKKKEKHSLTILMITVSRKCSRST